MMGSDSDADLFRSASLSSMAAHLVGPLAEGARQTSFALGADGRANVAFLARNPSVFLTLKRNLAEAAVTVSVAVQARSVTLTFAAYTEAGAMLPAVMPVADPITERAAPFAVVVSTPAAVALPASLSELFEVCVVEGQLGKLLYLLLAEKSKLRRMALELAAMRRVNAARGDALDRLGAELGVARQQARLSWDAASDQLVATTEREADPAYRQRLAIFRPLMMPTPRRALRALNGPDDAGAPRGLMAKSGYGGRVLLRESDTDLAIAIRLLSPPDDSRRIAHLKYLRDIFLLPLTAAELPPRRLVPVGQRQRARELLASLQQRANLPANAHAAPALALTLDRFLRVRAALGIAVPLPVLRAQEDAGGSRYELGLGLNIPAPSQAELAQMAQAVTQRAFTGIVDRETQAILDGLGPVAPTEDPLGRWLFEACGMRTVHPIAGGALYVSHFPVHGVVLGATAGAQAISLDARFHTPLDTGADAALSGALAEADRARGASVPAWSPLSGAQQAAAWQAAQLPPAPLLTVLTALDLPTPQTASALADTNTQLLNLPPELLSTLKLDAALSTGLLAGTADAQATLSRTIDLLKAAQLTAVLPLLTGGTVVLVVATTDLPGDARNLNNRETMFRWFTLPLEADARIGSVDPAGSRNQFRFTGSGSASQVAAVLAVTPARRGRSDPRGRIDPYNVQVDVGAADLLTFGQYEYLMNLLRRLHPIGVTLDTRLIREARVDLNQDGAANSLSPRLQRTFRPFRARRAVGDRRYTVED